MLGLPGMIVISFSETIREEERQKQKNLLSLIINCVDFSYHVCFNFDHYSVWLDGRSFSVCRGGQGLPPCPVALLYLNKQMQACAVHIKTYA